MSSTLFDTQVKIGISDLDFKKGIAEAGELMKGFASVGVKAIETVATSVLDTAKSFIDGVTDLASYGDHIDKQSQKMNMSAQAYQEWDAIMQHSGTTIDSMQMSMKTLANAADSDNEAFSRLGMNLDDVKAMSSEDLFAATITALQNVDNETERTAIASDLLGRGATELGALLNTSAEDTEKMRQRVHELGGVMSDDAVKASAQFKDSMQDMQTAMGGLKRGIQTDFLPAFTDVIDGITKIFAGEEGGEDMVSAGLTRIAKSLGKSASKLKPVIQKIGTSLFQVVKDTAPVLIKQFIEDIPKMINDAGGLFQSLGTAVMDSLPQIASAAETTVGKLVGYLRENLPEIIPAGIEAVAEFAKGITDPEAIGKIADTALDVVDGFIDGLTDPDTLDTIIDNAPVIVDNVVEGIAKVVDRLAESATLLCEKLVDYFSVEQNREKLKKASKKILDSIAEGFESLLVTSGTSIYNLGGYIAHNIGLGEYWDIGNEAMKEFADGFKEYWKEFKEWINIEVVNLLNPASMVKGVSESVSKKLFLEDQKKKSRPQEGFIGPVYPGKIPAYGDGGRVTKPTIALIGEKESETVIPDSKLKNLGGNTINLTVNVEGGISSDYDTDRFIERVATKLADLNILQNRSIGGTGYNG